jgi:DNA-directed RNA polymerase specialized sigma24 family protein
MPLSQDPPPDVPRWQAWLESQGGLFLLYARQQTRNEADAKDVFQEVLLLRIWGDLSFPAIARLTDVPLATATSRYRYALERLRGVLTELKP